MVDLKLLGLYTYDNVLVINIKYCLLKGFESLDVGYTLEDCVSKGLDGSIVVLKVTALFTYLSFHTVLTHF